MSYEEAIKTINEISARLGATAANLYPKLVKYGIVSNGIGLIMALLMLFVSAFTLKKCAKKLLSDPGCDEEGLYIAGVVFAMVGFILIAVVCYYNIRELVLWSTVPEIQAINFVLKQSK